LATQLKTYGSQRYLWQLMRGVMASFFVYLIIFILIHDLPLFLRENGLFKKFLDFSSFAEQKALLVSSGLQEVNLALNFLANMRKLSFGEAQAFQSSGLLHLLAISGGQVVPIAHGMSALIGYILYYMLRKIFFPLRLMQMIFQVKSFSSLVLSLFICGLFGCTGALIRVSALNYLLRIHFINSQFLVFYSFVPYVFSNTFYRSFVIVFVSLAFGNIFLNYSFLLSAIGASCAQISIYIANYFIKNSKIFHALSATALTSVFTGIILLPYSNSSILSSCLANIAALPVVCFLVTPLSLLVIFLPQDFFIFSYLLSFLDKSLFLLKKIAYIFHDPYSLTNPFERTHPLFSFQGLVYLNFILFSLWMLLDFHKERKILLARTKFTFLNPFPLKEDV
jgi:hypothetical protein